MFISFCGVACRGFNFCRWALCTTRVRQPKDLRREKSIVIILPTQCKRHILQGLSRRNDSLIKPLWVSMHGNFIQYWVNPIPVQFSPYINPNWKWNPSFLTLIIKRLGHLVFMGAIQCSAKRVYPPKDFRYHLTKNHHQYLRERVLINFAVSLRKSLIPKKCWLCSDHHHKIQAPVVQKLDSAIHRINHYPVDKY